MGNLVGSGGGSDAVAVTVVMDCCLACDARCNRSYVPRLATKALLWEVRVVLRRLEFRGSDDAGMLVQVRRHMWPKGSATIGPAHRTHSNPTSSGIC